MKELEAQLEPGKAEVFTTDSFDKGLAKMRNKDVYLAFLDLEKTCDRLPRSVVKKSLTQRQLDTGN